MTTAESTRHESRDKAGMDPQLTLLLELQDLRSQLREMVDGASAGELEREHFNIDLDAAREDLQKKIDELEADLSPQIRDRYHRILPHRERVVVPVINEVCYGCFVSIPTATARDHESQTELRSCENCGCFIYVLS